MAQRALSALLCWLTFACAPAPEPGSVSRGRTAEDLQGALDRLVAAHDTVPAAALHLSAPGLEWEGAAGLADPATGEPMTPHHPVRIASNTKTFVAAAVLRLDERGQLGLDDPIASHLSGGHLELLRSGGYDPAGITVRHLLTHTSGLYDHTDADQYAERILAEPQHRWSRTEQLEAAMAWGDPWGAPGEVYHYADSGYILLGEVLERATVGFERLGLDATWWETLEPPPPGTHDRAHQLLGETDCHAFDPSFDLWGGGGLVSTVGDLSRFWSALLAGEVYDDPATLETMLTTLEGLAPAADAGEHSLPPGAYRMGLWAAEVGGRRAWWHGGFWGTAAVHVPDLGLTLAATVNQRNSRELTRELARTVTTAVEEAGSPST